jgi:hypothetical protein
VPRKLPPGSTSPTATLQVSGSIIVSASAQTSTPTLFVGTNGRVGIGTAASLQVSGGTVLIDLTKRMQARTRAVTHGECSWPQRWAEEGLRI